MAWAKAAAFKPEAPSLSPEAVVSRILAPLLSEAWKLGPQVTGATTTSLSWPHCPRHHKGRRNSPASAQLNGCTDTAASKVGPKKHLLPHPKVREKRLLPLVRKPQVNQTQQSKYSYFFRSKGKTKKSFLQGERLVVAGFALVYKFS